jgi:hypothetical protein
MYHTGRYFLIELKMLRKQLNDAALKEGRLKLIPSAFPYDAYERE